MLPHVDLGNIFARTKFTMPTVDISHTVAQFNDAFALMDFLQTIGEQSAMFEGQRAKSKDIFLSAAAIMQTLFNA